MKDVEITCEVFEEIDKISKALQNKGLKYKEEFTLNDIYMENIETNQFSPKDGRITDTLIIRYVNENDKKIICKKRNYNSDGFEISTDKSILRVEDIEETEKFLNVLGYQRYLNMIDKNYMYESEEFVAYIQEIKDLGTFLEVEAKNEIQEVNRLIEWVKLLGLKIGEKFDIRKADLVYNNQSNRKTLHN